MTSHAKCLEQSSEETAIRDNGKKGTQHLEQTTVQDGGQVAVPLDRGTEIGPLADHEQTKPPQLLRIQSLASALESKPQNYLLLAIFTIFVNPPVAIIALVIAIDADNQYLRGYSEKARKLGLVVKYMCIVGIIITAVLVITLSSIYH